MNNEESCSLYNTDMYLQADPYLQNSFQLFSQ